ncbi:MAG: ABC transporter ATP-binding protein, partial [Candidatus Heimdallarchaeota archaeon]
AQLIVPIYLKFIIDTLGENTISEEITFAFIILVGLAIIELIGNLGMRLSGIIYSRRVMESIRQDIYHKLHEQELEFYSHETVGQLLARTIEEVYSLQDILTWGWRIFMLIILLSTGTFVIMFLASPFLSIVYAIVFPIMFYLLIRTSNKNAHVFYNSRLKFGNLAEVMAENFSGIKTVKSFGREQEQIKLFKEKNDDYIETTLEQIKVRAYLQPGFVFLFSLSIAGILIFGSILIETGSLSVGTLIAFLYLLLRLTQTTRFLGELGIYTMIADSAAIRLNEVLKSPLVLEDSEDAIDVDNLKGDIEFKNVSFTYPGNKFKSLQNIDLHIRPGEKVALLGPTGSGKTTIVNLIPRFYDPSFGEIILDGHPLKSLTRKSVRNSIQIVHQDNFLYTMELRENIAFSDPDSSMDQVIHVSKISQIHDFIDSLDKQYETIVGERGVTLSGGQRQRTTIARGLLTKPNIIIFDDSVSAVDPTTEAKIQKGLSQIEKDVTLIVISQRPSSLKYVDRVIVLDEGKIVQQGTHKELINEDGIYKRFVNSIKKQVKFIDWDKEKKSSVSSNVIGGDL